MARDLLKHEGRYARPLKIPQVCQPKTELVQLESSEQQLG